VKRINESEICPVCGLPKEICICKEIEKEAPKKIKIYTQKRKFRKFVTAIEGIEKNEVNEVAKELKIKIACGGTAKKGVIILQGNHKEKVKNYLLKMGYPEESITVV